MSDGDSNFTNLVASGALTVAGLATLGSASMGGGATGGKPVAGLSDSSANASGTTQNTEYVLNSVTLPANAFNANTRGVHIRAWGTLAANANAKNLKIYFGATAIATVTGSTANGSDFVISLDVVRTGASTQSAVASITIGTGNAATMTVNGAVAETDTASITIAVKSANTAAAAASATGKGLVAFFTN